MKKIILVLLAVSFTSCVKEVEVVQRKIDSKENLPEELKGLKVYTVGTDYGIVQVATLNGNVNSTNYQSGKTNHSTLIINNSTPRVIEVSSVVMENDSLIICRK
jgi:hypothetical protein